MSDSTSNLIHEVSSKVTVFGSFLTWVAANSSALTVIVFTVTGIASIIYGRMNVNSNRDRNDINRHNIKSDVQSDLIHKLRCEGKSEEFIKEVKKAMQD